MTARRETRSTTGADTTLHQPCTGSVAPSDAPDGDGALDAALLHGREVGPRLVSRDGRVEERRPVRVRVQVGACGRSHPGRPHLKHGRRIAHCTAEKRNACVCVWPGARAVGLPPTRKSPRCFPSMFPSQYSEDPSSFISNRVLAFKSFSSAALSIPWSATSLSLRRKLWTCPLRRAQAYHLPTCR